MYTHDHAEPDLVATILFLHSLIQDDVQENIVSTENTNDLAAAVELDKQALVEVL